jgi:arylsulfatase A
MNESGNRLHRRDFLKFAGLQSAFFLTGCSQCLLSDGQSARRPNIIYILADDLGYGDLSCYGQEKFQTPNIDRLAREGMRFTQHYAGSTVCAPSRCVLMTGLHTGHCQIRGNKGMLPEGQYPLETNTPTVARLLQSAGYRTGAIGKWGLGGPGSSGEPNRQGFDYFYGYLCQSLAHSYYPAHLWRNGEKVVLEGNDPGTQTGRYSHDLLISEALEFIRRCRSEPFFLYLPLTIPHAELTVPADSLEQYRGRFPETPWRGAWRGPSSYGSQDTPRAAFAAMISRMDGDVGRILDLLDELGLDEDTVVMFSSDNGPHKEGGADPDFFRSSGPLRGYKRDLYEGGIRVPLLVRWPGRVEAGRVSDHIGAFWDVPATLCELAGAETPAPTDGLSFAATLLGRSQQPHPYLYWEFHEQGGKQAVRMGRWKGVRLEVNRRPEGPIELYDLETDTAEADNVAEAHPEIVRRLGEIMQSAHTRSDVFPFEGEKSF